MRWRQVFTVPLGGRWRGRSPFGEGPAFVVCWGQAPQKGGSNRPAFCGGVTAPAPTRTILEAAWVNAPRNVSTQQSNTYTAQTMVEWANLWRTNASVTHTLIEIGGHWEAPYHSPRACDGKEKQQINWWSILHFLNILHLIFLRLVYNELNVNEFSSAAGPLMILCHQGDVPLMKRTQRGRWEGRSCKVNNLEIIKAEAVYLVYYIAACQRATFHGQHLG